MSRELVEALEFLLGQFDQAHDALGVSRSLSAQEAIAQARAALAAHRDEWQPIETAPKDGTQIIVRGGIAYWRERMNHWETEGWYTITGIDFPGRPIQWEVTHWQPFPAPPAAIARRILKQLEEPWEIQP